MTINIFTSKVKDPADLPDALATAGVPHVSRLPRSSRGGHLPSRLSVEA